MGDKDLLQEIRDELCLVRRLLAIHWMEEWAALDANDKREMRFRKREQRQRKIISSLEEKQSQGWHRVQAGQEKMKGESDAEH